MAELYTIQAAAKALLISPRTLARWRRAGKGPPYVRLGGFVRYRPADLNEWVGQNVHPVEEADGAS